MKPGLRKRTALTRRRSRGQSVVLIALILAVLIGLVALSVDVGNTYAQQRAAQRATDAASADAMTALLQGARCDKLAPKIEESLRAHGINIPESQDPTLPLVAGQRRYQAMLIKSDKDSTPVPLSACDAGVLAATRYIKVTLSGTEPTNFATLFGRPDLPVNSDSFAQRTICPPEPIGVSKDAFDTWRQGDPADPNDVNYHDGEYKSDRRARRLYLHTDPENEGQDKSFNMPGQFAWLSWTENATVSALKDALTPPGTLDKGFQEVEPWDENIFGKQPDVYPTQKGLLNTSDLVRGAPTPRLGASYKQGGVANGPDGLGGDTEVANQLRWLIDNHVAFNVAEYDIPNKGIGSNAVYHITGFKSYMLIGYGYQPAALSGPTAPEYRGYGWYFDLVELGKPLECAQNDTAPTIPDQKVTLVGTVNVGAVYGDNVTGHPPLDIVIMLDASGSMNWTFNGTGSVSPGTAEALRNNPKVKNGDIPCAALLTLAVGCQSSDAYKDYQQRKIYLAKRTLKTFMDKYGWNLGVDRAAIVTYSGGYNDGPGDTSGLTQVFPSTGLTTDITGLTTQMMTDAASKTPGSADPATLYTTIGASPGALGLKRAGQVLSSASGGSDRQRAVIVITDGLLNVGLDGHKSFDESINANYDRHDVRNLPTNQAINQARNIKLNSNPKSAEIFVISLGSQFDRSGLDRVASPGPTYLLSAENADGLSGALAEAFNQAANGTCKVQQEAVQVPDVSRTLHYTPASGFQQERDPATGQPSAGKVTVKVGGATLPQVFNIGPDGTFRIPNLAPNTDYTLSFNNSQDPDNPQPVFYMGLDTPKPFPRNYSYIDDSGSQQMTVHIQDVGISTTQFVKPDNTPIVLNLNGDDPCKSGS